MSLLITFSVVIRLFSSEIAEEMMKRKQMMKMSNLVMVSFKSWNWDFFRYKETKLSGG